MSSEEKVFKSKISKNIIDYIGITIGCAIMAIGMNALVIPNKIAPGGVSGLATVIYHIFGLPVGIVMLCFNIPLFILGIKVLGAKFGAKTFYGTIILSIMIDYVFEVFIITEDIFLASVFGGILMGIGLGIVFRSNATTGGTDLIAAMLHKYFGGLSIGVWLMIIDMFVVVIAGLTFKMPEIALYSIITLYTSMKMIDLIQEGINYAKAFYIISDKYEDISKEIIKSLDRGVTALKGQGMYTRQDRNVLFCIVHRSQVSKMKQIVHSIDSKAFVILADVHEVLGEGFKNYSN